ncbi:MAG: glycosyltransferase family 4 protein [Candidatus Levyibacteriota bacterium]
MRVAIDHSPLVSTHKLAHKIRGTGYYTKNLIEALQEYHPEHEYVLFTRGEKLQNIDLFHFPYFEPFFVSLPLRKLGKTVVTIHDLTPIVFPQLFPSGIRGKVKFQVQKRLVKMSDAIITDSYASKKDIESFLGFPSGKVHAIHLAASEDFKKAEMSVSGRKTLCAKYRIPEKFILYVGDATPNKNLKRLVDSLPAGLPLVMVGSALTKKDVDPSNPWNAELVYVQKKAEESKNIYLLGFVPDEDLPLLYNAATVFVFPSFYEGFGLPVLEAASCGTPVVTTKGGSIPEVIGEAAYIIDPLDELSIETGIREVFESKDLQEKLSKKGLEQAKKFSWKKTADETVQVYEGIYQ